MSRSSISAIRCCLDRVNTDRWRPPRIVVTVSITSECVRCNVFRAERPAVVDKDDTLDTFGGHLRANANVPFSQAREIENRSVRNDSNVFIRFGVD